MPQHCFSAHARLASCRLAAYPFIWMLCVASRVRTSSRLSAVRELSTTTVGISVTTSGLYMRVQTIGQANGSPKKNSITPISVNTNHVSLRHTRKMLINQFISGDVNRGETMTAQAAQSEHRGQHHHKHRDVIETRIVERQSVQCLVDIYKEIVSYRHYVGEYPYGSVHLVDRERESSHREAEYAHEAAYAH